MSASPPSRTPLGRCGRVKQVWRRHGKRRVPEMTESLVQIITSFCRQRGKLKTRLVFGVPPPLLSPSRIWFKGENQDGRRFRAGRKSWQLLRKVRKLAPEFHFKVSKKFNGIKVASAWVGAVLFNSGASAGSQRAVCDWSMDWGLGHNYPDELVLKCGSLTGWKWTDRPLL